MAKTQTAAEKLAKMEEEDALLAEQAKQRTATKRRLKKEAKAEGAKMLAASITRLKLDGVTKPLADQIAKRISALGIAKTIERLK